MVSSVRPRPNHYERLGLKPSASDAEIKQAFAREMSLFGAHRMGEAAQFLVAYETLRNPARRRDYDRSIGLTAPPRAHQWTFAARPHWETPFIAAAGTRLGGEAAAPAPEPHVRPEPEPFVDPRIASIAATLQELARPAAFDSPPAPEEQSQEQRQLAYAPAAVLEQHIQQSLTAQVPRQKRSRDTEDNVPDWKYPFFAIGGLVVAAGVAGTLAGLSATDSVDSAQAEPAALRPAVRQQVNVAAPAPAPVAAAAETLTERPASAITLPKTRQRVSRQRPTSSAEQVQTEAVDPSASTQSAAEPGPAPAIAADLPLSNNLVARTIERIGYPCGEIASTAPVEGGGKGVYRITCSSGHSYQATPVHGRYRFRRVGSR